MNIKRLYFDMKLGQVFVFPIISMINFIVITHTLTILGDSIPLSQYIPVVVLGLIIALIGIGYAYRRIQQTTDHIMIFERNPKQIECFLAILRDDPIEKQKVIEYLEGVKKKNE